MHAQQPRQPAARMTGYALLLLGGGLVAFSLLADRLDFGGGEGFGYQQLIVLIVGIAVMLGGVRIVAQSAFGTTRSGQDRDDYDRRGDQRHA